MKRDAKHTIDFLFPIALFFVFASTALVTLLLASNLYQKQIDKSLDGFQKSTAISYLTEKIRQNDSAKADIHLCDFDGQHALSISQAYNDTSYTTYIYEMDGMLTELFVQDGIDASSESGIAILEVDSLEMKELSPGLFQFICTSDNGSSDSVIIQLQSN